MPRLHGVEKQENTLCARQRDTLCARQREFIDSPAALVL